MDDNTNTYTDTNTLIVLIIILFVVIVVGFCLYNVHLDRYENYEKSECSDVHCQDTKLLKLDNELMLSPIHYMSVDDFNTMIIDIQTLIVATVKQQVDSCHDLNGEDGFEKSHMTFSCIVDPQSVEDLIIERITAYIMEYIKNFYDIDMNPILIISDIKDDLSLLEDLIYPLMYSGLYTVQRFTYFTYPMLINRVTHSLKVEDVLYTTLQRRGIEVIPNDDNDI